MLLPLYPNPTPQARARRQDTGLPRPIMLSLVLLACSVFVLEYGLRLPPAVLPWLHWLELGLAAAFAVDLLLVWRRAPAWRTLWQQRWYEYVVLALWGVGLAAICVGSLAGAGILVPVQRELLAPTSAGLGVVWSNLFVLLLLILRFLRLQELLLARLRPELLLSGSFVFLILLGTVLLQLPRMSRAGGEPISGLDALFTATSAVCVTGLTVRDTGGTFSSVGQVVLMVLMQAGGLGIMTFVATLAMASAQRFSLPQVAALREIVRAETTTDLRRQVLTIIGLSFAIEAVGAALLYLALPEGLSGLRRLKWCVFHAVSAFCNAGFGLERDSLMGYRGNWGVNLTIAGLIILGGIGFHVLRDLTSFRFTARPWFRRWAFFRRREQGHSPPRLRLDTKLTLLVTLILLVVGTVGLLWLEAGTAGTAGWSWGEQVLAAFFQSVSARTAGFNTVNIGALQNASILLLIVLMAIGASPNSTGGGIKTATFAVLLLTLRAVLRGGERVQAFGRAVSRTVVQVSVAICTIYVMAALLVTLVLAGTNPGIPLRDLTFEAVSALSTVGLSTGITVQLNDTGKLVLCLAMFAGRVGPLSAAMLMVAPRRQGRHAVFPDEGIVVG